MTAGRALAAVGVGVLVAGLVAGLMVLTVLAALTSPPPEPPEPRVIPQRDIDDAVGALIAAARRDWQDR
jgi:uncharacterized membrane protein YccC